MRLPSLIKRTLFGTLILGWVTHPGTAHPLGEPAQQNAVKQQVVKRKIQVGGAGLGSGKPTASSADEMLSIMGVRIEEMRQMFDLDPKQTQRLQLAAKLVSKRVFDERQARFAAPLGVDKGEKDQDEETFSDQDSETDSKADKSENKLQEILLPVEIEEALDHEMWKKAIDSVLTAEQKESLSSEQAQRDQRVRQVAVQYRVWQIAERLRLRLDQIEPLSAVVDKVEGEALAKKLRRGNSDMFGFGNDEEEQVAPEDLEEILSAEQMKLFKKDLELDDDLLGLGKILGLGGVGGGADGKERTLSSFGIELDEDAELLAIDKVTDGSDAEKLGLRSETLSTRLMTIRLIQGFS